MIVRQSVRPQCVKPRLAIMNTMVDRRDMLIFDTSGLNALANDKDNAAITTCLGMASRVRLAADIYERYAQQRPSEAVVRAFVRRCPPFNMMMLGSIVAQFHRSVRDFRLPAVYKAGRLDLLSAVYLPYCDRFVTHDDGQYNALKALTAQAGIPAKILSYAEFQQGWLVSV